MNTMPNSNDLTGKAALITDASRFVTGSEMVVDGGFSAA